jgi:hypothetical protein
MRPIMLYLLEGRVFIRGVEGMIIDPCYPSFMAGDVIEHSFDSMRLDAKFTHPRLSRQLCG